MAQPLDAVMAIHNAFRRDARRIGYGARQGGIQVPSRPSPGSGNAVEQRLHIHFVDAALNYELVTLD